MSVSFPKTAGFRPLSDSLRALGNHISNMGTDVSRNTRAIAGFLIDPKSGERFLAAVAQKPNASEKLHDLIVNPDELPMLRDDFKFRTALDLARVHRWAGVQDSFVLPRLHYTPHLCDPDNLGRDLKELDDADLAQMALAHMMGRPEVKAAQNELSQLVTHGGTHHELLVQAVQREVGAWSELFGIPDLQKHIEDWKNGLPLPVITMTRFMPIEYLRNGAKQLTTDKRPGVDTMSSHMLPDGESYREKYWAELEDFGNPDGIHFFLPHLLGEPPSSKYYQNYGLPSWQNGIISQLVYEVPLPVLLIFLAASDGRAYIHPDEFALWESATHLFNHMLRAIPDLATKVKIYHFDGSEPAQQEIQLLRDSGVQIEWGAPHETSSAGVVHELHNILELAELADGLKIDKQDIVARSFFLIDNHQFIKRGLVGVDCQNIENFFYQITLMPVDQAVQIISRLVETQPSLAQEAGQFYAGLQTAALSNWADSASTSRKIKKWINAIQTKYSKNQELFKTLSTKVDSDPS